MSKIGVHVTTGSRNGYGLVCEAKPSMAFVLAEGGALRELYEKSAGYSYRFFRDITVYGNDPGLNNMTEEQAREMADLLYPRLKAIWLQNEADYYAVLNEPAANNVQAMRVFNAYERRMMELAEVDGFLLCIGNLFTGTPDDGSVNGDPPTGGMETWKREYGPHIARAFEGGHVYGRHVYGYPDLVPLTFNTDRPFREAEWLNSQGLYGGIALTELGLDGGMVKIPEAHMLSQMAQFDGLMQSTAVYRKFFIGGAWWTYGDFHHVNIQDSSIAIADYLNANPSARWEQPDFVEPAPEESLEKTLWAISVQEQETCGIRLNAEAGLEKAIKAKGLIPVHSETAHFTEAGEKYVIQGGEDLQHVKPRETFIYQAGKPIWSFTDPHAIAPGFKLEMWPVGSWTVTQRFAENYNKYSQYCDTNGVCLKGHNGWDIAAPEGSKIIAATAGRVIWASDQSPSGGASDYGWHVRIESGDYLIIYAHMKSNLAVQVNQLVTAGDTIGYCGSTGNSNGPHLHFEMRKCPGLEGWPWCIIDCSPFLEEVYRPPVTQNIDMRPYFRPVESGVAPFFVLQHGNGTTEDIQVQVVGESIYVVKNNQYEHLRLKDGYVERREDTSVGDGLMYTLDDGYGWSRWCPLSWAPGDYFRRNPDVTLMYKDCTVLTIDENVSSYLRFDEFYPAWTSPKSNASPNGITLKDVIQLSFSWTIEGPWIERYWLSPGLGPYCQWMNDRGEHSWISELPSGRDPLQRDVIHCLSA